MRNVNLQGAALPDELSRRIYLTYEECKSTERHELINGGESIYLTYEECKFSLK